MHYPPMERRSKFGPAPGTNIWHRGRLKLDTQEIADLVKMYIEGAIQTDIAERFCIAPATVRKYLKKAKVLLPRYRPPVKEKPRVNPVTSLAPEPTIVVEKGVPFMETKVEKEPQAKASPLDRNIRCENKDLSLKENLTWAIEAAGELLRTGAIPTVCPNNSAFFLYEQACGQSKDFLAKFLSVAVRTISGDEDSDLKKDTRQSLSTIQDLLDEIEVE